MKLFLHSTNSLCFSSARLVTAVDTIHVIMCQYCSTSIGRISEWEGLRSRRRKRRGGWGVRGLPHPHWGGIYGGGYAPPQKSVHFAMLQTTKYCSRIQVKTHSTMLSINFLSSYVNKQHTWAILFYHVRMTSASCHNDVPRL